MMPCPVVVRERGRDFGVYIGGDGLVEDNGHSSVVLHAQLQRGASSLDSTVVWRGIRRPAEPRGDCEVRGGYRNRRRRDSIPGSVEKPRLTGFPGDVRRISNRPSITDRTTAC